MNGTDWNQLQQSTARSRPGDRHDNLHFHSDDDKDNDEFDEEIRLFYLI